VEFLSIFPFQALSTNTKPPVEDFLATFLSPGGVMLNL